MKPLLASKAEGTPDEFGNLARHMGLEPDMRVRTGTVVRERTTDFLTHAINLVVRRPTPENEPEPVAMVLSAGYRIPQVGGDTYFFRLGLTGELERAFVIRGPDDSAGEAIRGAGKAVVLDIADPEVLERFKHEADFWLRGMYRRAAPERAKPARHESAGPAPAAGPDPRP